MNQTTSKPASSAEISDALRVLFDAGLPFQRGAKADSVAMAYVEALQGMSLDGIHAGIRKFLRGECEDVSPRFVPTPPEMARIVRTAIVPSRVPEERRIAPFSYRTDGERYRMRLKMPMWKHAMECGLMDDLARANADGFDAMVILADKWGVPVPPELFEDPNASRAWAVARNTTLREIERNPPPYELRRQKRMEENRHLPIIRENVSYEEFRRMSNAREIPAGARWVPILATVFGPEVRQEIAA